jgi:hypothetical protein
MTAADCLAAASTSTGALPQLSVDSTKLLSRLLTRDDVSGVISELDAVATAVSGECCVVAAWVDTASQVLQCSDSTGPPSAPLLTYVPCDLSCAWQWAGCPQWTN